MLETSETFSAVSDLIDLINQRFWGYRKRLMLRDFSFVSLSLNNSCIKLGFRLSKVLYTSMDRSICQGLGS